MADILNAMTDPALFGDSYGDHSFASWRTLLAGFYGLPIEGEALDTWRTLTGRQSPPQGPHDELWLAVGRRGGKSHAAALVAVYEAAFRDHRDKLARGEVATVMLLAADRKQARTLLRYVRGLLENPMLARMVARETADGFELTNRSVIEVGTASNRSVRGYTLAAAICDEVAFWQADGVSPDVEILAALRPALATLGGKLVALSSPYARRGALWETYRRHYGIEGSRVLVAQAPSQMMNPTLPESVIDDAMREDAARASAEYMAQFRDDIAAFIAPQLIDDAMRTKPLVKPRFKGERYFAFCDPSGGGPDEFTLAIGHVEGTRKDGSRIVVDLVEGRSGSPAETVRHYAEWLEAYGISRVVGDRYAGRWPRDEFLRWGIRYEPSEFDRSALYIETLAALHSGRLELPPDEKMRRQFLALERRTGSSGRDVVDHPPGGHDDRANAVAGLVAHADARAKGGVGRMKVLY